MDILGTKTIRISGGNLPDGVKFKYTLKVLDDLTKDAKNEAAMKSIVIEYQKIRDTATEVELLELQTQGTVTIKASEAAGDPIAKMIAKMTPEQKAELREQLNE